MFLIISSNPNSNISNFNELNLSILRLKHLIINSISDFKNNIKNLLNSNNNLSNFKQIVILKDEALLNTKIHDNTDIILNNIGFTILGYNSKSLVNNNITNNNEILIPIENFLYSFDVDVIQPNAISNFLEVINQIILKEKLDNLDYLDSFNS